MKVGTFRIVDGQKQGGNVASYFCLPDGAVVHAVPGKVDARTLLTEARWAIETRKFALTQSTDLEGGGVDMIRFRYLIRQAHEERFAVEKNPNLPKSPKGYGRLPSTLPGNLSV